jgi:UDP-glucose 4-epimerase
MSELTTKKGKILVTGCTGYIGSHVCKVLFERGYEVIGLDINLEQNDVSKWVDRLIFEDVRSVDLDESFDAIVHLAGVISVEESMSKPTHYYDTNLNGTLNMLSQIDIDTHFIFASTAGAFDAQSPYAKSKVAAEDVIKEQAEEYTIFRFFNVAGSDGDNMQQGNATHLIRIASECAANTRPYMSIFGTDYDTKDGTCVRDYIHVVDLANAIANAVKEGPKNTPFECIGSGTGYTVKEVIETMKKVSGSNFEVKMADRREGDPASLSIANQFDGLEVKHTLEDMCRSAYLVELVRNGVL